VSVTHEWSHLNTNFGVRIWIDNVEALNFDAVDWWLRTPTVLQFGQWLQNAAIGRDSHRDGARILHLESQVQRLQEALTASVNERRENDLTQQVTKFALAFGYPVRTRITEPTADEAALRLRLITEEFLELLEAHGAPGLIRSEIWDRVTKWVEWQRGGPGFRVDIVKAADALADIDYVVEGTRLTYGIPRQAVANEVQRSNMAKAGGTHDPVTGKLQKPPGWTPPDIDGVLARYR
jgi:predicted HAD superfamily Cof-like phosphohydrolase